MKKILGVLIAICFAFIPMMTKAAETVNLENYKTLGLKDVLKEEEIAEKFKNYTEKDDQITIYLFRGKGCAYCRSFLTFLNGIAEEYGKYFKVVAFETWYDENNTKLLEGLSEFMESPAQGVPYIIIGKQVFPGYASDYDESIKSTIKAEYEAEERYDAIEAYNDHLEELERAEFSANNRIIIWNFAFILIATISIILYVNHSNKKLFNALTNNDKIIEAVEVVEPVVEVKEQPVKKTTKKQPVKKTTEKKVVKK